MEGAPDDLCIPDWAGKPPTNTFQQGLRNQYIFRLDVMKNQALVETIHLQEQFYTFGRQIPQNSSGIHLEHPSISRLHAVLAYNRHESCWFIQDTSTHGTWVNKKKVEADFVKVEEGDIIEFGHSTRQYAINPYLELETNSQNAQQSITWGMDNAAEEALYKYQSELDQELQVQDRLREAIEVLDIDFLLTQTLSEKQRQLANRVQIFRKKAQKNDNQTQKLEDVEDKLRTSLKATLLKEDSAGEDSDQARFKTGYESDDIFYDQVKPTETKPGVTQSMSHSDLKREMERLIQERESLHQQIKQHHDQGNTTLVAQNDEVDELDMFMQNNQSHLQSQNLTRLSTQLAQVLEQINSVGGMLALVKPIQVQTAQQNLLSTHQQKPVLKQNGLVQTDQTNLNSISAAIERLKKKQILDDERMMAELKQMSKQEANALAESLPFVNDQQEESETLNVLDQGTSLQKIMQEIVRNSNANQTSYELTQNLSSTLKRDFSTLGKRGFTEIRDGLNIQQHESQQEEEELEQRLQKRMKYSAVMEKDQRADEEQWEPPSGQLGDGVTSLNAKYGY